MKDEILLSVEHLTHSFFPVSKGLTVRAVDDLSFSVRHARFSVWSASPACKSTAHARRS